jgi:DNA polymerase/3'-5' exonuclease PolX
MGIEKLLGIDKMDIEKITNEYTELKSKIDFIYFVSKGYYVNHKEEIDKALLKLKENQENK